MFNLSIIIPHYNSPLLLKKLLVSIPDKNDIELLVIDDNSNEGLKEYEALKEEFRFVKYLSNNRINKGAGSCRNIGLDAATGRWLLFADADDYFVNGFYEIVKPYFQSDFDVIFFRPTSLDLESGAISDRHQHYAERVINYINTGGQKDELELRYKFFIPWSKLIRRDILMANDIRFDEIIVANDMMFSVKLGYHMKTFHASKETIYCNTSSPGTLTKRSDEKHFDIRVAVYIDYYKYLKNKLDKDQFKILDVSGRDYILRAMRQGFPSSKILKTYLLFLRNRVKVFRISDINFIKLVRKLKDNKTQR